MNWQPGLNLHLIPQYRFYDTPDGEDFFKKLGAAFRWGTGIGLGAGTVDVLLLTHPKTYMESLGRYIYFTGPIVGMASAFSSVTYLSANLRGKDDSINHLYGGIAAGTVYGRWLKSFKAGTLGCVMFGLFALVKKYADMNGVLLLPTEFPTVMNIATVYKHDFTLTDNGTPRWTTDPNDTELDPKLSVRNINAFNVRV